MESGGSTKPWLVTAIDQESYLPDEAPYVVKLFTQNNVAQGNNIGKEFFCNKLAGQFDLYIPEAALIDINFPAFRDTLDPGKVKVLAGKYPGLTYASKLTEGSLVTDQLKDTTFNIYDCATLFAFDCLILNTDRGGFRNKPNLLMNDNGLVLIDHELTLYFLDNNSRRAYEIVNQHLQEETWPDFYRKHLFYNKLRTFRGSKRSFFDAFEESLRTLNINDVQNTIADLGANGISLGQSELLIDYLRNLKQNSSKFRNILLGLIA